MQIIRMDYGGLGNGTPFDMQYPIILGMHAGEAIDALILNGNQYGGPGGSTGGSTQIVTLKPDDYWNRFHINYTTGTTTGFIINLGVYAQSGISTVGGGVGFASVDKSGIRILRIGGRYVEGRTLSALSIEFVDNYQQSHVVEHDALAVIDFKTGPATISTYAEEKDQLTDIYKHITTRVQETTFNASAQGEYYAKFAVSTGLTTTETNTTDIETTTQKELDNIVSEEQQIDDGAVAMLCCTITIMKDSDGSYWYYPSGTGQYYVTLNHADFARMIGHYDLTGVLDVELGLHHEQQNGLQLLVA